MTQANPMEEVGNFGSPEFAKLFEIPLSDAIAVELVEASSGVKAFDEDEALCDTNDSIDHVTLWISESPESHLSSGGSELGYRSVQNSTQLNTWMEQSQSRDIALDATEIVGEQIGRVEVRVHCSSNQPRFDHEILSSKEHSARAFFLGGIYHRGALECRSDDLPSGISSEDRESRDGLSIQWDYGVLPKSSNHFNDPYKFSSRDCEDDLDPGFLDQAAIRLSGFDVQVLASANGDYMGRSGKFLELQAKRIAREIFDGVSENRDSLVEILLDPMELGRVRISISSGDRVAVAVLADQKETYILLKQNVELLEQELRSVGISGADISFSTGKDGEKAKRTPSGKSSDLGDGSQHQLSVPDMRRSSAAKISNELGIDIRI
ncbi:flagellar hook-length control protein FliK [Paracoccus sp. MKU1]|uniref:flagellar hook-length control protein FliK n=1 Tax=Paracoccus sp. MKU1 TaxID=1745182 RepID=UPI00137B0E08|nr:flagellar hook-length control protein FliK [Paracoccus sp. MKU1]